MNDKVILLYCKIYQEIPNAKIFNDLLQLIVKNVLKMPIHSLVSCLDFNRNMFFPRTVKLYDLIQLF